jgi:FkbM family methyltransferase
MKIKKYFQSIRQQDKSIKFVISKILIRLKISQYFSFNYQHHILKFYPSYLSRILWVDSSHGHSGSEVENFVWTYLKTDDTFLDIGANIGTVTLEASKKIGNDGKVFSFEPTLKIFEFLKGNVQHNNCKNVKLYDLALGEKSSEIYFSNNFADEANSIQYEKKGTLVQMKTLDEIIPSNLKIDLMKIDVAGYEKFVFIGAEKTLKNTACIHFPAIETFYKKYGYTYKDVFNILKIQNFLIYQILSDKTIKLLDADYHPKIGDYIAIKNLDQFLKRYN